MPRNDTGLRMIFKIDGKEVEIENGKAIPANKPSQDVVDFANKITSGIKFNKKKPDKDSSSSNSSNNIKKQKAEKYKNNMTKDKSSSTGGSYDSSAIGKPNFGGAWNGRSNLKGYAGGYNPDEETTLGNWGADNAAILNARGILSNRSEDQGKNAYKIAANQNMLAHAVDDLSLLADIGLLPEEDLMRAIRNKNLKGALQDRKEDSYKDFGVDLDGVCGIIGLPYMADNVVDPPPIWRKEELSGVLNSWESGRVGKDFTKRVLERGQYLVLMPIELRPNITDTISLGLAGATASVSDSVISGLIKKVDSVEQRLNVTSYGFTAKIASKRYWRSVQAHAKAIFYSLGIDEFMSTDELYDKNKKARLKQYLPDYLVDNVYATDDMKMTIATLKAEKWAEQSELEKYDEIKASGTSASENGFNLINALTGGNAESNSLVSSAASAVSGGLGKYDDNSNSLDSTASGDGKSLDSVKSVAAMYSGSMMAKLIHYIMNIDDADDRLQTMPYVVFYCNGPIDRSYSWSIETNTSKLGEHAILGTKKAMTKGFMNIVGGALSAVTGGAGEGSTQEGQTAGKESVAQISDALDPMQDMMNEWAFHNSGKAIGTFLINNLYVPKVQSGGGSQFAYTVPIRDMALSSDRYSLARLHFTTALLIPYVYQTTYPRQALIIPSSALYCAAFSKGVMNCPRAVISNMSIKTDNAFQTTFGVPTELDITLTIEPLYTVGITPDFNKYWSVQNHPEYFLGAMWNPMSSINMLATMCGQNTVFSKMPIGLFKFFVDGTIGRITDTLKGGYASFRASVRDYFSTLGMSQNNYKMI